MSTMCFCGQNNCHCSCQQMINSLWQHLQQVTQERDMLAMQLSTLQDQARHVSQLQSTQTHESSNSSFASQQQSSNELNLDVQHNHPVSVRSSNCHIQIQHQVHTKPLRCGHNDQHQNVHVNVGHTHQREKLDLEPIATVQQKHHANYHGENQNNQDHNNIAPREFEKLDKVAQWQEKIQLHEADPLLIDTLKRIRDMKVNSNETHHLINAVSKGQLKFVIKANLFAQQCVDHAINDYIVPEQIVPQLQDEFLSQCGLEKSKNNLFAFDQYYSAIINEEIVKHTQWLNKYCKLLYCLAETIQAKNCSVTSVRDNLFALFILRDNMWDQFMDITAKLAMIDPQEGNGEEKHVSDVFDKYCTQYMVQLIDERLSKIVEKIEKKKNARKQLLYCFVFRLLVRKVYDFKDASDINTEDYAKDLTILEKCLNNEYGYPCTELEYRKFENSKQRQQPWKKNQDNLKPQTQSNNNTMQKKSQNWTFRPLIVPNQQCSR